MKVANPAWARAGGSSSWLWCLAPARRLALAGPSTARRCPGTWSRGKRPWRHYRGTCGEAGRRSARATNARRASPGPRAAAPGRRPWRAFDRLRRLVEPPRAVGAATARRPRVRGPLAADGGRAPPGLAALDRMGSPARRPSAMAILPPRDRW